MRLLHRKGALAFHFGVADRVVVRPMLRIPWSLRRLRYL